jgi:hypothetical protein
MRECFDEWEDAQWFLAYLTKRFAYDVLGETLIVREGEPPGLGAGGRLGQNRPHVWLESMDGSEIDIQFSRFFAQRRPGTLIYSSPSVFARDLEYWVDRFPAPRNPRERAETILRETCACLASDPRTPRRFLENIERHSRPHRVAPVALNESRMQAPPALPRFSTVIT